MTSFWRESIIDYIRTEAQPVDKFGHQPRLYALFAGDESPAYLRSPSFSVTGVSA